MAALVDEQVIMGLSQAMSVSQQPAHLPLRSSATSAPADRLRRRQAVIGKNSPLNAGNFDD